MALKEAELRADYRMLEKKRELLKSDTEEMVRKRDELTSEKEQFEEQHR